jgi:hypothetical protein
MELGQGDLIPGIRRLHDIPEVNVAEETEVHLGHGTATLRNGEKFPLVLWEGCDIV